MQAVLGLDEGFYDEKGEDQHVHDSPFAANYPRGIGPAHSRAVCEWICAGIVGGLNPGLDPESDHKVCMGMKVVLWIPRATIRCVWA